MALINASSAYARGATGAGALIGIMDSGVDISHQELDGLYKLTSDSYLEYSSRSPTTEEKRHGTHVAAIALGEREREMAHALVRLSRFKVILVDPDSKMVQQARSFLDEAGVYGERVSVHHGEYASLPYGAFFANLVIVHDLDALNLDKDQSDLSWLKRMIRPAGGTFCVALSQDLPSPRTCF